MPRGRKKKQEEVAIVGATAGTSADGTTVAVAGVSQGLPARVPEGTPENIKDNSIRAFEYETERQIMQETLGAFLTDLVYQYEQSGRTITGISYAGTKFLFRKEEGALPELGRDNVRWTVEEDEVRGKVLICEVSVRSPKGHDLYGIAEQPTSERRRDGSKYPDYHARKKCLSKAHRNALQSGLSEQRVAEFLLACLEGKEQMAQGKKATVSEMTHADAKLPSNTDVMRLGQLKRVHSILRGLGVLTEEVKAKAHKIIAQAWKPLDEMTTEELKRAGDLLHKVEVNGKGVAFMQMVLHGDHTQLDAMTEGQANAQEA